MRTRHTPRGWNGMTRAQRRVAVAKDVLAQIEAKRVEMVMGAYAAPVYSDEIPPGAQYSDVCEDMRCEACAIGAAFLSLVRFRNARSLEDMEDVDGLDIREAMKGVFPVQQLDLMESAYERKFMFQVAPGFWGSCPFLEVILPGDAEDNCNLSEARREALKAAIEFGRAFHDAEDRAVAIFQNIVDHGGEFNPVAEYEVEEVYA